jgi:hypothetical protein
MTTEGQGQEYMPESGPVKKNGKQRRMNIIFTIVFIIFAAAIGFLLYTLLTERKDAEEMRVVLEMQKDNLTRELNEIYMQYDSLQTENDTMNLKIEVQQQKIRDLLAIRESNAKKIQIYEREISTMRDIMRNFVRQVDSLNQANLELRAENLQVKNQIREATSVNRQLEENLKKEQAKVETASVVKMSNIIAEPIMDNGSLSRRTKRTEKFRVCFTVNGNPIAKQGPKQIYLRIGSPDDRVMVKDPNNTFKFEGETLAYSAFREISYEGVDIDVCIYYDLAEEEAMEGTYYCDLYMDGELVGTTSFSLR